ELHPLCAEAALLAGHDGLWSVVATLTEGLAAGTLAASTPAMLQHLEDLGQAELAGMLQRELLEFGEAYDFGADLQTQLVKMRDDARRAASETALAGLASASEVTADMRALIPGVGAPDAGN
ncbi:MAG: hypothetical protein KIT73_20815, partial [Burkholderiales bacterium]|nr:hypothetical protein [Burkholderiales bacterium]